MEKSKSILETISLDHQNDMKHFGELLKTKAIAFEQYSEMVEKSQKNYNEMINEILNTLREDMKLFYQSNEKIAEMQPRSFGEILRDSKRDIAEGLEVLTSVSN